jgi:Family of unknown function (DUF6496)
MAKKRATRRTGRRPAKGLGKVSKVMREYKHRTLRSGSGGKVRKRKQAVAIALSEARRSGARIPRRRRSRAR